MQISPMGIDHYRQALALWQDTPGVGLSSADSRAAIAMFLERNPGLSFVAHEEDALIATIMVGHDGRRGYVYHLAVRPDFRSRGVGSRLVECGLRALERVGIAKCHLFVFAENEAAQGFWRHADWEYRGDVVVFSKNIAPAAE